MQMTGCHRAIEQLSIYLEDPAQHPSEGDAAMRHIRACPYCERRIGHLVQALTTKEIDMLSCQECQNRLPEYFVATTTGQADDARWSLVALHLETCPHCSEEFATLADLLEMAEGRRGVEPSQYPEFNLSFLPRKATKPRPARKPWHLDALGRLVIEFSAELVRGLQPLAYAAALKSGAEPGTVFFLDVADAVPDLHVSISADRTRTDPTRCTMSVEVMIPSRGGWPHLAGSQVVLKHGDLVQATQITDAFGKVVFTGIAEGDLDQLVFEIKPATGKV
jgi:hypothetical protein